MNESHWKVGFLGAGFISESHAKSIQVTPNAELVAICDQSKGAADKLAAVFGVSNTYDSLEEMLKSDVDVIHVLLPPDLHFSTTKTILEAGKHVMLEKPMVLTSKEAQSLVDLAKANNVKLGVNHNFLFSPAYEKMRNDVKDGLIGNLDTISVNWMANLGLIQNGPYNNWMLREPKNLFFEIGPHLSAFVLDMVGDIDNIEVSLSRPRDIPGGNRVWRKWNIRGNNGLTAIDMKMSLEPGYIDKSVHIRGASATAKCDFERSVYYRDDHTRFGMLIDNFLTSSKVGVKTLSQASKTFAGSVVSTFKKAPGSTPFGRSMERSIRAFYDGLNGTLDSRVDGQFGVKVMQLCEAVTDKAAFSKGRGKKKVWNTIKPHKKPTVLVLGGTGFIGQYLVKALCDKGYGVRVVTRNQSAGEVSLAGLPVELVAGSLADADFMDKVLKGITTVYHLARTVGSKWEDYYNGDVLVTKNIAERAMQAGVKKFIYTGTIDSYYSAPADQTITCDTPVDPDIENRNLYARSKATCEATLMEMHKSDGLPLVIMRPGIVIGKGCNPFHWGVGMWGSETTVQFWGNGENKLPIVLAEDVADALVSAIDAKDIDGEAFNLVDEPFLNAHDYIDICSQESNTKIRSIPTPTWKHYSADLVKNIAKHAIKHPNRMWPSYKDWDSRSHRSYYDCSKARNMLTWKPASNREIIIEKGIIEPVQEMME